MEKGSVKPWMVEKVLQKFKHCLDDKVIISVVAGLTHTSLQSLCPSSHVIRTMPNTPSQAMVGTTILLTDPARVHLHAVETAKWIFECVGEVVELQDEEKMDACTAVSGSGPAFVAMFLEAMIEGGVAKGIPRPMATKLAAQSKIFVDKESLRIYDY